MRVLLSLALVAALALPAAADHCATWSTTAADVPVAAGPYYVDTDCYVLFCPYKAFGGVWIYEESNGIAGLQRDDEVVDDTCHGLIDADTIIF